MVADTSKSSPHSTVLKFDSPQTKLLDSVRLKIDTLAKVDTADIDPSSEIKDKITYKAVDSIVYDIATKKMYLYNGSETHYQKITMNADAVEFDWTTMVMTAKGVEDTSGEVVGKPIFKDDGKEYRAGKMLYNFKNQRGKVFEVSTQEGEAYLHSEAVKKIDETSWFGYKSKYTTCNLDHPHFYFKAKKIKLVPNKVMVTGPANLWIGDVPTPLYIPFGIFPVKQNRRSGIIMPKYGGDRLNGFFLKEGGYYWAVNDNFDLKLTGTVYTNGTFGFNAATKYKVNYKFSGSFAAAYIRSAAPDPDLPNTTSTNDFKVNWSFQLDPKAAPNNSFNMSVNVSSANFNNANRATDNSVYQTAFNSNISYQRTFPRAPFLSFTIAASHSQNLQTRDFSINFPTIGFNVNRVTPFKSKINTGKKKWYENIGISYAFQAKNSLSIKDSLLSKVDLTKRMQYGINQNITLDASFDLFKYFKLVPSVQYTERWYFQTVNETWINKDQVVQLPGGQQIVYPGFGSYLKTDTIFGFKAARDFNTGLSLGTKVTGIYHFKGKYVKALRHLFTPSISGSYRPDFGSNFWGYYSTVRKGLFDAAPSQYGHFDIVNGIYGAPPTGKYAALNWSLNNNFDMKVFSKKDTINHEKIIGILERFNISGGYNFAADSLRLQPFNISGSMKLWDNISANFGVNLDPYALGSNGRTINTFYWTAKHQLLRFTSAQVSVNANFHGKAKPTTAPPLNKAIHSKADYVSYNPDEYYDFNIPWNLNVAYTMDLRTSFQTFTQRDSLVFTQALTFNGDFNLTKNWKVAVNSGYDFANKQLLLTRMRVVRNLHCWELSFDWTAWPINYQQFNIELKIVNPMLQDLKLTRKRSYYQN